MSSAHRPPEHGHVALVTGANHGIGAATARALGSRGVAVLVSYLRIDEPVDPGTPERYRTDRADAATTVVTDIHEAGGRAAAAEEDLSDPTAPTRLFDAAEAAFGPVEILVNNASGWVQDTFKPASTDHLGRGMQPVRADTFDQQFAIDTRAPALLISEFARRHVAHGGSWGRIVGLTSGGELGFPEEVSYGAAKAAQENYTMSAATELAPYGVTANMVYPPVTDTGWVTDAVREFVASSSSHHHVATPAEVADVIAWLTSDAGRLVTANILRLR